MTEKLREDLAECDACGNMLAADDYGVYMNDPDYPDCEEADLLCKHCAPPTCTKCGEIIDLDRWDELCSTCADKLAEEDDGCVGWT